MKAQNKVQSACDISVYLDKGSLALRFPKRHNALWELLDGKSLKGKPKCLGIGKYGFRDCPDDWKRASQLATALEADLDHPEWDKLFDRTLAKYGLGGGKYAKLADVLQMPGTVPALPEITVGEMWEAYLEWKRTVIEETTFKTVFERLFSNTLKGASRSKPSSNLFKIGLENPELPHLFSVASSTIARGKYFATEVRSAFDFAKSRGLLKSINTQNPFLLDKFSAPVVTTQQKYANKVVNGEEKQWHELRDEKELENDRRAFTKDERDIIIKAFYDAPKKFSFYASLIEFYFLTGCRTNEAFALTWKDIDFERRVIRFSKSLGASTRKLKETKTGEIRFFYFQPNSRLEFLLVSIRDSRKIETFVFPDKNNNSIAPNAIGKSWTGNGYSRQMKDGTGKTYYYPGVVTQLVEQGKISGYLPQYHTRHTYITLTAEANKHDTNALLYIATSCGNSVDVILKHYLDAQENIKIIQV